MILLDTKALLFAMVEPQRLGQKIADQLNRGVETWASTVSIYEIEVKRAIGKLQFGDVQDWETTIVASGFRPLELKISHAARAGQLPLIHRDPWDRLLIAQAQTENLVLATDDQAIQSYGVVTIW